MIVIDTSTVVEALAGAPAKPRIVETLAEAGTLHAPHLIDAEILHALRGLLRGRKITLERAEMARQDFADLRLVRYPLAGVANRVWELRDAMTAYDACFVALAEALACPLVTSDGRLSRSSGHDAEIRLIR